MEAQHEGLACTLLTSTHIKQLDTITRGNIACGLTLHHRGDGEGTAVDALEEIGATAS